MNSKSRSKKRINDNSGVLNRSRFKPKRRKLFSNPFKQNLVSNWIENDLDSQSLVSVNSNIFQRISPIKRENQDKDSLQLDNLQYLSTMKHLLFLDLENFSNFFQHLTHQLPDRTHVIAFTSSNNTWKPPKKFGILGEVKANFFF